MSKGSEYLNFRFTERTQKGFLFELLHKEEDKSKIKLDVAGLKNSLKEADKHLQVHVLIRSFALNDGVISSFTYNQLSYTMILVLLHMLNALQHAEKC